MHVRKSTVIYQSKEEAIFYKKKKKLDEKTDTVHKYIEGRIQRGLLDV